MNLREKREVREEREGRRGRRGRGGRRRRRGRIGRGGEEEIERERLREQKEVILYCMFTERNFRVRW